MVKDEVPDRLAELLVKIFGDELYADIDQALRWFEEVRAVSKESDLPRLVEALGRPESDFWIREMLADPIAELGGLESLRELIEAFEHNFQDGHDNDGFQVILIEVVESDIVASRAKLNELRSTFPESVEWLLEFCEPPSHP